MAFLQRLVSNDKYRMQENKKHPTEVVEHWVTKISTKNEHLGGHKICPFAKMPRVVAVKKLSVDDFVSLDNEITVYMETEISSSYQDLEDLCKKLKDLNPNFVFLPDHPCKSNYIRGQETGNKFLPCIIVQTKQELDTARAALDKTDYYTYWDQTYLAEIRSFD